MSAWAPGNGIATNALENEADIAMVQEWLGTAVLLLLAVKHYSISSVHVFSNWEALADSPDKVADALVIATQGRMHRAQTMALAQRCYHMLLGSQGWSRSFILLSPLDGAYCELNA